jgi:uncharacterized RDD family membrane protein YckC
MENPNAKIYAFPVLKNKIKSEASKKRTRRINAFVTDLLFIQVFQKMAIFAYIEFVNQSLFTLPIGVRANLMGNLSQMRNSTMFFSYFSYFLIASYLFEGRTIGKSIFNLRVVNPFEEGESLSFRDSFFRAVGYTISYMMLFLPFLASAFSKDGKGLPDYLSQTEVMTDEQYNHHLLKLENQKERATPQEPSVVQKNPSEQLDLFAA